MMYATDIKIASDRKWWVLFGCSLMLLLVNLDVTIVNLALASMNVFFHQPLSSLQWVISSYAVTAAIGFITIGKIARHDNLKTVFLVGIALFIIGSLVCGLAHHFATLIIGRVIQGLGLASTLNIALLIVKKVFPDELQGFAIGCCTIMTGLALAIGPSVGGLIIYWANWRWIFFVNVPIALLAFIISMILIERDEGKIDLKAISILSFALLSVFLLSLIETLTYLSHKHFNTVLLIALIVGTSLAFFLFYYHSKKEPKSILDSSLLRNKDYCLNLIIRAISMIFWASLLFSLPLYLQNVLAISSIDTGLVLLTMMLLFAVCAPISGRIIDQRTATIPMHYACIVGIVVMVVLSAIIQIDIRWIILPLLFMGGLFAFLIVGTVHQAYAVLSHDKLIAGIGTLFSVAFISVIFGVAMAALLLNNFPQHLLTENVQAIHHNLSISQPLSLLVGNNKLLLNALQHAYTHAMQIIFLVNACLLAIAAYCARLLRK